MSRISKYPIVITPADDDVIPVVQSGITKKMTLNDLKAYAVQELGDTYVRFLWYQEISSGTSGTITPPTGGTIVLDQWAAGIDAVTSKIGETGQRPSFESAKDASGNIITATLDGSGNWTISGTPSAYPIAICYVYDVKLSQADRTKSLEELETDQGLKKTDSPTFATVKCTGLTDGYIPKHTSDATGLENSPVSDRSGYLYLASSTCSYLFHDSTHYALQIADINTVYDLGLYWDKAATPQQRFSVTNLYGDIGIVTGINGYPTSKRIRLSNVGNLCLGADGIDCGTNAMGVIGIGSGTAPTSSPADMAQLWVEDVGGAGQAELRVRDELGNVTTLSPHHIEQVTPDPSVAIPFTMHHKNDLLGIEEEIDMGGLVKAVEGLTGKQFSFVQSIPKIAVDDYLAAREADLRKRLVEELSYEEEVSIEEAVETNEVDEATKEVESYRQKYAFENGVKVVRQEPVYKMKKVQKVVLKEGVRLCENTGMFFIKRQPATAMLSAELTKRPVNNLPKWITDRTKE